MESKQKIIEAFTSSLPEYLRDVETASGKLFYSITWSQIGEHITKDNPLTILDIGCGFGLTSIWLSQQGHKVTGIDITPDMIEAAKLRADREKQNITFLQGGIEDLNVLLKGKTFDWIMCHNVLGYLENPMSDLEKLSSLLNPEGYMSIIAHNPAAKVLKNALVDMNMTEAKESINKEKEYNSLIGADVHQYRAETYYKWFGTLKLDLIKHYGIRCVFDYLRNANITQQDYRFQNLLDLELELGKTKPYRDIAFFSHFVIQKRDKTLQITPIDIRCISFIGVMVIKMVEEEQKC